MDPRLNIPSQQFTSQQWQDWYNDLSSYFPRNDANTIWVSYWLKRQNDDANDNALRTFMKSKGVTVETGLLGKVRDEGGNIIDSIGNVLSIGKWAIIGLGALIVIPLFMLLFNIARKPIESMNAASKFAK